VLARHTYQLDDIVLDQVIHVGLLDLFLCGHQLVDGHDLDVLEVRSREG
jgi:hypothetical protein